MSEKIIHLIWKMDIGGAERAVYQLVREQRRCGMQADLLVASHAGFYGEKTKKIGARVIELSQKHTFDLSITPRVQTLLQDYSIVHFHSPELGLMKITSQVSHLKRFYTHRAGIFHYPVKQLLRYKIAGYYLRKYFHGVSGNTNQAALAASRLFRIPLNKILITYNGIDFSLLDPKRSRQEVLDELNDNRNGVIRIGTSANLRPCKRIEWLLEAVAKIKNDLIHCCIIGDGPSREELEQKARALGIDHITTFVGKKEHIGDFLQVLDIFVLPSGPEESFGNSAVEAMGVGLPTIVFADGGGLTEHVVNLKTGFVVNNVNDLVEKLRLLVMDQTLRLNIGSAAKAEIRKRYSLEKMVANYNSFYEMALSTNPITNCFGVKK